MACGDPGRLMWAGLREERWVKGLGRKKGSPSLKYMREMGISTLVTYINRIRWYVLFYAWVLAQRLMFVCFWDLSIVLHGGVEHSFSILNTSVSQIRPNSPPSPCFCVDCKVRMVFPFFFSFLIRKKIKRKQYFMTCGNNIQISVSINKVEHSHAPSFTKPSVAAFTLQGQSWAVVIGSMAHEF